MPPAPDEDYIMCNECGARLWSDAGSGRYRGIPCPYRQNGRYVVPGEGWTTDKHGEDHVCYKTGCH